MNEVEKMYENAEIKPKKECYYWSCPYSTGNVAEDKPINERNCKDCSNPNKKVYPPFTAEKQIELIKWLAKKYREIHILNNEARGFAIGIMGISFNLKHFEEIIAMVLNTFWQDLTEEERKQIKEILE